MNNLSTAAVRRPRLQIAGFSLTEVMVALAILGAVIAASTTVTSTSYRGTVASERHLVGLLLAEGLAEGLAALPFGAVTSRPATRVVQAAPYGTLLAAAATRSPTAAAEVSVYLEEVDWLAQVTPAAGVKRLDVTVRWPEGERNRSCSVSRVSVPR